LAYAAMLAGPPPPLMLQPGRLAAHSLNPARFAVDALGAAAVVEQASVGAGCASLAARLTTEAQSIRARCLESTLEAARQRNVEEVGELEDKVVALRAESAELWAALSQRDAQLAASEANGAQMRALVAAREGKITEREREVAQLQAHLEEKGCEVQRLQTQLCLVVGQLHKSDHEASAAKMDKERALVPTQTRNVELGRNLATREREVQILQKEVETAGMRGTRVEVAARQQQDKAMKVQATQGAELAFKNSTIKQLEAQLAAQAAVHQQTQQRLSDRCRLLQAWCFRTWWSLEGAGSSNLPGLASEESVLGESLGRQVRLKDGSGSSPPKAAEAVTTLKAPPPNDWRGVLRFQASLFHWLTAETIRGKALRLQGRAHELELPLPRKEVEQKRRSSSKRRQER